MRLSLESLCLAIGRSIVTFDAARQRRELAERDAAAAKKARAAAQEAEWRAELQRREEAALDADGSRAAARAAREEQLEEQRLAFLSAQLAKRA